MKKVFFARSQEQISPLKYQQYLSRIPENMKARITRYHHWQDNQVSLFSRLLLIEGIRSFGLNESILQQLKFEKYRRPFLEVGIDFNISHSNEWAICALSDCGRIGVDIEQIKQIPLEDFTDTLTATERNAMDAIADKYWYFYHIWAKKEAATKAEGRGLIQPFNEIILKENTACFEDKIMYIKALAIDENYASYVATDRMSTDELEIKQFYF